MRRLTLLMPGSRRLWRPWLSPRLPPHPPILDVFTRWGDANLKPGDTGLFVIQPKNLGDEPTDGSLVTVTLTLPPGVSSHPTDGG